MATVGVLALQGDVVEHVAALRRAGASAAEVRTPADLAEVEIAGVGFGIYFPRIDADLLVSSIAEGRFGNDRWEAAWLADHPLEDRPVIQSPEPVHTHAA